MNNKEIFILIGLILCLILVICAFFIVIRGDKQLKKELAIVVPFALIMIIGLPMLLFTSIYTLTGDQYPGIDNTFIFFATIIGACFTGFITAGGLFITIRQTREIQNENRIMQAMNEKKVFINDIQTLVAQYITEIGLYFYAQTMRDKENPPEINRKGAIHAFRLIEIKLQNTNGANKLLEKIRYVHESGCVYEIGDNLHERSKKFEDDMNSLKNLTIAFGEDYMKLINEKNLRKI